ncbi:MAG TPA: phosphate ABC transporter permease subunit PstC [Spirochaetia bacterium]|nr:phosphate ABC transporter permease subunit PstC [Spirochaetia bacterium]
MRTARASDSVFRVVLFFGGIAVSVLLIAILLSLLLSSRPALVANGFRFLTGSEWDPVTNSFHALPFVFGTLVTSAIALAIATVLALALAVLMGEYFRTGVFASLMRTAVELLAGIPSIVYGFIGLFFLVPAIRVVQLLVGVPPFGVGILTSSILLAFMILPYSASIAREMLMLVPSDLKEAALSLGATRSEMIRKVSLPYARSGIMGGIFLSLGRALGETMAVTMVIGNSNIITLNLLSPGNTMASLIANEFSEAQGTVYLASLIEIALLLFVISTVINILGKVVINRMVEST